MSRSNEPLPPQIDGFNTDVDFSDRFANVFPDIYKVNDSSFHDGLRHEFESIFPAYYATHPLDDISRFYFTWQDITRHGIQA